jgi:prephenate dehydratase
VQGEADFAVMAIENARSGSILYNYTLIRESGMKILGEQNLRIKQNLMALKGQTMDDIREIRSHPIALSQCMAFLNEHPGITLIESEDTAASARQVSENQLKGVAAIAPIHAAEIYGLEILAEGIETYKQNYTRFLVVGNEEKGNTKGNKVSICFSTGHRPGSLAAVLVILANLNINLSKIQSVPRLNGEWEYMFYLDLELDPSAPSLGQLLRLRRLQLPRRTDRVRRRPLEHGPDGRRDRRSGSCGENDPEPEADGEYDSDPEADASKSALLSGER